MVDRMLKCYDALKNAPEDAKQDSAVKAKERLAACTHLSEAIVSAHMRNNPEFQKLLAVAVAGLLYGCSDVDSDVRMNADECLNRMIKTLIETHLGRLQVELYKVMKKEDTATRTLRAAVSKFSDLCHLVKPFRKEVFVKSLLPSLLRIIGMNDETLQETLALSIGKICSSLGLFFSDSDTTKLLSAMLVNLTSQSPVIRRTAADCVISVCRGTAQPYHYLMVVVNSLFSYVPKPFSQAEDEVILGVLVCFRKVVLAYQEIVQVVTPREQIMDERATELLLELLLECLGHSNHNVITASLEAMQQLLTILQQDFLAWFCVPERCGRCIQKLGGFLLSEKKIRVSVKAIALSCLTTVLSCQPSAFYTKIEVADRFISDALEDFCEHSDPLLRANVYLMLGSLVKASLQHNGRCFDTVPAPPDTDPEILKKDVYTIKSLTNRLLVALNDDAATASRNAIVSINGALEEIFQSTKPEVGLEFLRQILTLSTKPYWLVKTEVLEVIGSLNYILLAFLEMETTTSTIEVPPTPLSRPRVAFKGLRSLQNQCVECALFLLGDEDGRVREAASKALNILVGRLYYNTEWKGGAAMMAMFDRQTSFLFGSNVPRKSLDLQEKFIPLSEEKKAANLSRIVKEIIAIMHTSQSRSLLMGCYHALNLITASSFDPLRAKFGQGPLRVREIPAIYPPDLLPLALDHIKVAWISLDLSVHVNVLGMIGNVSMNAHVDHFRNYSAPLLSHVMRVLNICVHVINETAPVPPNVKASKSSSKNAPVTHAFSPDRSRTSSISSVSSTISNMTIGEDDAQERAAPPGSPVGYFAHLPHYMKLYDVMKGAFTANRITLDAGQSSRFSEMVKAALEVLAVVVKNEGQAFQGHAEEILSYLTVVIITEPRAVLLCVHQLLIATFGPHTNNSAKHNIGRSSSMASTPDAVSQSNMSMSSSSSLTSHAGIYEIGVRVAKHKHLGVVKELSASISSIGSNESGGRRGERVPASSPARPQQQRVAAPSQAEKAALFSLIRLFEPLVIRAMNQYVTTSYIPLQQQILFLLCRLMTLRVNYSLLDKDHVFVDAVLKHVKEIEAGHVHQPEQLLSYIFQFFMLLLQERNFEHKMIQIPRLMQMASGLLDNEHLSKSQAIPCLKPVVHELFVVYSGRLGPRQKESDVSSQRAVLINVLIDLVKHPPIVKQLNILMKIYQNDDEKLRRLSRKILDCLLPFMARRDVCINNLKEMQQFVNLLNNVSASALRPPTILLKTLFAAAHPDVMSPIQTDMEFNQSRSVVNEHSGGFAHRHAAGDTNAPPTYPWLPIVLLLIGALRRTTESALLASLETLLQTARPRQEVLTSSETEPADVLCNFLFRLLKHIARKYKDELAVGPSDFFSQQFAALLRQLFLLFDSCDREHSQVFLAAQRYIRADAEELYSLSQQIIDSYGLMSIYLCQLFVVLGHDEPAMWNACGLVSSESATKNANREIARRGAFLVQCEALVLQLTDEASNDTSQVEKTVSQLPDSWFKQLVEACSETPVQRLIQNMTSENVSDASMGLFVKGILTAVPHSEELSQLSPTDAARLLEELNLLPMEQENLLLLGQRLFRLTHPALRRRADLVVARKIGDWVSDHPGDTASLAALKTSLIENVNHNVKKRFPKTVKALAEGGFEMPVDDPPVTLSALLTDSPEDWHFAKVKSLCSINSRFLRSTEAVFKLIQPLSEPQLREIFHMPDFDLRLLVPFLEIRATHKPMRRRRGSASLASESMARVDSEDTSLHLFEVTANFIFERIADIKANPDQSQPLKSELLICKALLVAMKDGSQDFTCEEVTGLVWYAGHCLAKCKRAHGVGDSTFLPWHLTTAIEGVAGVLSHAAIIRDSALCPCPIADSLRTIVDDLYHFYSACVATDPDPTFQSSENDEKANEKLYPLTIDTTHKLAMLLRLITAPKALKLSSGIVLNESAYTTDFVTICGVLRRAIVSVARLCGPCAYVYSMLCNPDSGNPSHEIALAIEELLSQGGEMIRQDLFHDDLVLRSHVARIRSLGWANEQFQTEQWESLLMLATEDPQPLLEMGITQREINKCTTLAINGLTTILMGTMAEPQGDPYGEVIYSSRTKDLSFLHTRPGNNLLQTRSMLDEDSNALGLALKNRHGVERCDGSPYGYGQLSVRYLARRIHDKHVHSSAQTKLAQFLDILSPWLTEGTHLPILSQAMYAALALSDLFTSPAQFKWLYTNLVRFSKAHSTDDTMVMRYVTPAIAKAVAVLSSAGETMEIDDVLMKQLELGMQSQTLSTQIAVLYSVLYLIDGMVTSVVKPLLPLLCEHLLSSIQTAVLPHHFGCLCAVSFAVIEHYPTESEGLEFAPKAVQEIVRVTQIMGNPYDSVFCTVLSGLDRLLLTFALQKAEKDAITKLAMHTFKESPGSLRGVYALGVVITHMYAGKATSMSHDRLQTAAPMAEMDHVPVAIMEQISALFDPIRRGDHIEARIVVRALPALLRDFFPPRQIMNYIMAEFTKLKDPNLMAPIVHNVFGMLQRAGHQLALQQWAILSMSSFLQRSDKQMAVFSLACLFTSVSNNPIIRSFLYHIMYQAQHGDVPHPLFWLPAMHFVINTETEEEKAGFLSIMASIQEPPYAELVGVLSQMVDQTNASQA